MATFTGTDASGNFSISNAPPGSILVSVFDPNDSSLAGVGSGVVPEGGVLNLDVAVGNAVALPHTLTGDDGTRYTVGCSGALESESPPYSSYWGQSLTFSMFDFPCLYGTYLSSDKRELTFGPVTAGALQVTRRVFSPQAGRFVRFLDSYRNTSNAAIVVPIKVNRMGLGYAAPLVTHPSTNDYRYAVIDQPAVATVFGGAGGVPNPATTFKHTAWRRNNGMQYDTALEYSWNLTVPPNDSVSLLHYSAQASDAAAAQNLGQAMSLNAESFMFDRITAPEKLKIQNFAAP
jgi:hypothetical protein